MRLSASGLACMAAAYRQETPGARARSRYHLCLLLRIEGELAEDGHYTPSPLWYAALTALRLAEDGSGQTQEEGDGQ